MQTAIAAATQNRQNVATIIVSAADVDALWWARQRLAVIKETEAQASLHYGLVRIVKGQYRGRVGNYDDDEGPYGIVYLYGEPQAIVRVKLSSLQPITDAAEADSIHDVECALLEARAARARSGN